MEFSTSTLNLSPNSTIWNLWTLAMIGIGMVCYSFSLKQTKQNQELRQQQQQQQQRRRRFEQEKHVLESFNKALPSHLHLKASNKKKFQKQNSSSSSSVYSKHSKHSKHSRTKHVKNKNAVKYINTSPHDIEKYTTFHEWIQNMMRMWLDSFWNIMNDDNFQMSLKSLSTLSSSKSVRPDHTITATTTTTGIENVSIIGIDCEMVGVGIQGKESMLARCSIVQVQFPQVIPSSKQNDDTPATTTNTPTTKSDFKECFDSTLLQSFNINDLVSDTIMKNIYKSHEEKNNMNNNPSIPHIKIIYDKLVQPSKRVVDYRTPYSGITPEMLRMNRNRDGGGGGSSGGSGSTSSSRSKKNKHLPLVSFGQCQREVSSIFASSLDGKHVLVVGHDVKNDFAALRLTHPQSLVRDTSYYRPFMNHGQRRCYKRKLSILAQEELGITIQAGNDYLKSFSSSSSSSLSLSLDSSTIGHSSIEDATATLLLYLKHFASWEKSLGYPLRTLTLGTNVRTQRNAGYTTQTPFTLFVDGCNLPLGLRRTVVQEKSNRIQNGEPSSSSSKIYRYQLISKTSPYGTTEVDSPFDWITAFQSITINSTNNTNSIFGKVVLMYDGNMFRNCREEARPNQHFDIYPNLQVEITDIGVQVDDVLVEKCRQKLQKGGDANSGKSFVNIRDVIQIFERQGAKYSSSVTNSNHYHKHYETWGTKKPYYIVVRRKGGGRTKRNKKLFGKLNLRRAEEGAYCLTALTPRLCKHSLSIAREMERASVHGLVEYEILSQECVSNVVVTDDILLADRLVKLGVIVLNYKQMQQLI